MRNVIIKDRGNVDFIKQFTSFEEFLLFVSEHGGDVVVNNYNINITPTVTINRYMNYEELHEIVHGNKNIAK